MFSIYDIRLPKRNNTRAERIGINLAHNLFRKGYDTDNARAYARDSIALSIASRTYADESAWALNAFDAAWANLTDN